eukprot:3412167-Alexandrium_andersonii.AAC.1
MCAARAQPDEKSAYGAASAAHPPPRPNRQPTCNRLCAAGWRHEDGGTTGLRAQHTRSSAREA